MDIGYLLRILFKRKWLILAAMLGAAGITFFMIGRKPERYKASVIMATGIVNYKGINSDNSDAFVQQYQVDNAFSNLIEFAQSRSTIKLLTVDMLQHDLMADSLKAQQAFRGGAPQLVGMGPQELEQKAAELRKELSAINLDSLTDPSFSQQLDFLLDRLSRAYGYDHDAIRRCLSIKRKGETDYLSIEVTTESPALSQYMANTYAKRLIKYYHNLSLREKRKNVETFTLIAAEKKWVVDSITEQRFQYLKAKGLPTLGKQSEELVTTIAKLEIDRQRAESKGRSAKESVQRIDNYMKEAGARSANETSGRVAEKNKTEDQFQRVRALTQKSLEAGGKDPEVEAQLAEAKRELERSVSGSAKEIAKRKTDDGKRKQDELYKEQVNSELERIEAEESAARLNQEIWALKNKLGAMAASDEISSKLQADEDRARVEFEAAEKQRIEAKMRLENSVNPLSIVENAQLPEWPEPNRQTLISIFAAVVMGTLTTILLFVLAYFDRSLQSADLFKRYTNNLPLLGIAGTIPLKDLDFRQVFSANGSSPASFTLFRESLRKIRSQLLQSGKGIYLIASAKDKEGKTFIMHALAFSLAANNKRVLMLDTNFRAPLPEAYADQPSPNSKKLNKLLKDHGLAEVFLSKKKREQESDEEEHLVDVLGNAGLLRSPSELLEPEPFRAFLEALRGEYDYILMEAASLSKYSDAQELMPYADRLIAVFNARFVLRPSDDNALQYLRDLKEKFAGAILTDVDERQAHG